MKNAYAEILVDQSQINEKFINEINLLDEALKQENFLKIIQAPYLEKTKKNVAVDCLNLNNELAKIVKLIIQNNDISDLKTFKKDVIHYLSIQHNIYVVNFESAFEMEQSEIQAILKKLTQINNKTYFLDKYKVNQDLILGFKIWSIQEKYDYNYLKILNDITKTEAGAK